LGYVQRGAIIKLRQETHFYNNADTTQIWEFYVWSWKNDTILKHSRSIDGDNIQCHFFPDDNRFGIYLTLGGEGYARNRLTYVMQKDGVFTPPTSDEQWPIDPPPDPLISLTTLNSSLLATSTSAGIVKPDGTSITIANGVLSVPEQISPWLFAREIDTVHLPTNGTYHIGDLERGEVARFRHDVHFSGATNNADIWDYYVWSYKDGVTLIHDKHRQGDDLSYWFNAETNKFEIYIVLQEGMPRHRDYYFQSVHPGEAGFVPATDMNPVQNPPSPLLSINMGNSSNLAAGDKFGFVKPDNTTITIAGGVISAASAYTLPIATTTVLGGVKGDNSTITIKADGTISANYTAVSWV
jgi:hypothetical protein